MIEFKSHTSILYKNIRSVLNSNVSHVGVRRRHGSDCELVGFKTGEDNNGRKQRIFSHYLLLHLLWRLDTSWRLTNARKSEGGQTYNEISRT